MATTFANMSSTDPGMEEILASLKFQVIYTVLEVLVAIVSVIGNAMVIAVFFVDKKLRKRTNYYILSLAVADFLVGLVGIPFAIMASVGLPTDLHWCLFSLSILIVLCVASIFCLVAVSADRYWAILYPMEYSRNINTKITIRIIIVCWLLGSLWGFLPLLGWHMPSEDPAVCFFVKIMDYRFLSFLFFSTALTPSIIMVIFYAHIYRVVLRQLRPQSTIRVKKTSNISVPSEAVGSQEGGMLRNLGPTQRRDVKATKSLAIIVMFFLVCWLPLQTINCIKFFWPNFFIHINITNFTIILSHLNSAVNPMIYAYHLKDFRFALKKLTLRMLCMKESESEANDMMTSSTNPSKKDGLNPIIESEVVDLNDPEKPLR